MRRPLRLDVVYVRLNEHTLHGDVYVGEKHLIKEYISAWTPDKWVESAHNSPELGRLKEKIVSDYWNNKGGYIVLRPVFEEENEFGMVCP